MITLVLHHGGQRLQRTLSDGVYRVGRQPPAELVIADGTISASHAELQVSGENCTVRDLGSRNGTWVNGVMIRSATSVGSSDQLRFGSIVATIEAAGRPATSRQPQGPAAAPQAAAPAAAPRVLRWSTRSWIAAGIALACSVVLLSIVLAYNAAANRSVRRVQHFREFAAQYVNVLPGTSVPAPAVDGSLQDPIRVFGPDGTVLYPAGTPADAPSVLRNPETKEVYEAAKHDLFTLPQKSSDGAAIYSYPITKGGDLLGFVSAAADENVAPERTDPGAVERDTQSPFVFALTSTFIAAALSAIVLLLLMRPVHTLVRKEIDRMQERISAVANGVIDTMPRSEIIPELNAVAAAVESGFRPHGPDPDGSRAGRSAMAGAFENELAELNDQADIAYCFIDADYNLLHVSSELRAFRQFAGAVPGQTLFASSLSTVQARELVNAINNPIEGRPLEIELTRGQTPVTVAVHTRRFRRGSKTIHGLLFCPPQR